MRTERTGPERGKSERRDCDERMWNKAVECVDARDGVLGIGRRRGR